MPSLRWLGFVVALTGCADGLGPTITVSQGLPLIGGQPDTATRGVVGLVVGDASGCTGSLIAPNLVLTARLCVASIDSANGTVQCGITNFGPAFAPTEFTVTPDDNIRNGVPTGAQYGVERVVTTPNPGVCGNDVSLLILSSNVASATAPLLVPRVDGAVTTNESFDAVGYGITDPNDTAGATFGQRLRVNDLSVRCVGTACSTLGGTRTEWGAVTPVCSGDSGGPALDAQGRVIGVASRGNANCDSALYGSVASWRSLIVDTAIDAATSGGYSPPGWATGAPADAGTTDAGTTDAGTTDAGTTDAGTTDAGTTDAGTSDAGVPAPDAGATIGDPCEEKRCAEGLGCYLPEGDDIGICVPSCSTDATCPLRHTCSPRLGICVPDTRDDGAGDPKSVGDADKDGGCGCHAAVRPDGRGALVLSFLMLVAAVRRRRVRIA
jgi:hypothetical protein